jgi:twitching motility protein PilT
LYQFDFARTDCDICMLIQNSENEVSPILRGWLMEAVERGASDLHLVGGYTPILRLHGELEPLAAGQLSEAELRSLLTPLLSAATLEKFLAEKNLDFALELSSAHAPQRFRVNYLMSGHNMAACFRIIPNKIPDFEWASFPTDLANRLAHFRDGLVLVCGVTGSGKTTTLAMLVNFLIQEGGYRIITVEEPIEYTFPKTENSVVTQREVGQDVLTFSDGLKYGLRQDPDVILVGEIRDRDTGQMALSAAETGHLVLASMHSRDAKGAISRFADLFPQTVQPEIRSQIATSLRAVVSQHLLPNAVPGAKRELALEVMFNNPANASAIRMAKLESIDNNILTSRAEGMLPLTESVKRLLKADRITRETAEYFSTDKNLLRH